MSPDLRAGSAQIVSIVSFTGVTNAALGLTLVVLPLFLHETLALSTTSIGVILSLQAISTLLARPLAGRIADRKGVKTAVLIGLSACAASGALTWAATLPAIGTAASVVLLSIGRLLLGLGTGLTNTGALSWGIAIAHPTQHGKVMSYNGVAAFGMLAITPPLGFGIARTLGLWSVGAVILAASIAALGWALSRPRIEPAGGARLGFVQVLGRVFGLGSALGLSSFGVGAISTFMPLFYASNGWAHPAWPMSAFSVCYLSTRLLLPDVLNRREGKQVAIACFIGEALALSLIAISPQASVAVGGAALTGISMALIFPALGTEVVRRVTPASRSSALGAYSLFVDISTGLSGLIFGMIASGLGFRAVFVTASCLSLAALIVTMRLRTPSPAAA